jgi:hypothetical protein
LLFQVSSVHCDAFVVDGRFRDITRPL